MAHDVFISYSSKDKTAADAVCATLESRGIRCWIAPRDILPGADWGEAIINAIASSKVMVLMYSANANASPQIKREVERAVNKGVTVMPLRLEDVPMSKSLEYFISTPHWLDALTPPLERHFAKLADTIGVLIAQLGKPDDSGSTVLAPERKPPPQRDRAFQANRIVSIGFWLLFLVLAIGLFLHFRKRDQNSTATSQTPATPSPTIDHKSATAHLKSAIAAFNSLDDVQALAELNAAIGIDVNLAEAYWQRARVHDFQGNTALAKEDRDQAMKLGYRPSPAELAQWASNRAARGPGHVGAAPGKAILARMQRNIVQDRLGVTLTDEPAGPRITLMRVDPAGVAAKAGFKAGDVLEQPAPDASPNLVRALADPSSNTITLKRSDGQPVTLDLPPVDAESIRNLAFAQRTDFNQDGSKHPVLLPPDVLFGARAHAASTQPGDHPQAELAAVRAEASVQQEKYDQALAEYTDAITQDPASAKYRVGRGQVLFHLSRNDEAIADFTEAIRLTPQDASAYRLRSLAYTAAADNAHAQADAQTADSLDAKAIQ